MERLTYTYFFAANEEIKIGKSVNPNNRFSQLKTARPNLRKVLILPFLIEKELHTYFNASKNALEWFNAEPVLEFLKKNNITENSTKEQVLAAMTNNTSSYSEEELNIEGILIYLFNIHIPLFYCKSIIKQRKGANMVISVDDFILATCKLQSDRSILINNKEVLLDNNFYTTLSKVIRSEANILINKYIAKHPLFLNLNYGNQVKITAVENELTTDGRLIGSDSWGIKYVLDVENTKF